MRVLGTLYINLPLEAMTIIPHIRVSPKQQGVFSSLPYSSLIFSGRGPILLSSTTVAFVCFCVRSGSTACQPRI